jgi:phytoene dehydrogenase-like protein
VYTGAAPAELPAAVQAYMLHHFLKAGGFYPRGGGQVLAAHLADVILAHRGTLRTRARVREILVDGGRARGVRLEGGEAIQAPVVVSNADAKRTYLELIGARHLRGATLRRAKSWRMGFPIFGVYVAVDFDLREIMSRGNYWRVPSYDTAAPYVQAAGSGPGLLDRCPQAEQLVVWISSATVKDPAGHALDSRGHSTLEIMMPVAGDLGSWGLDRSPADGERYQKTPGYLQVKHELAERMVSATCAAFPQIKGRILWQEASTPISHERYTLATGGAWAGIAATRDQLALRPGCRTEISGLFLTGQSTRYGPGIVGTLRGGVATASAILDRDLWAEIRRGEVFGDPGRLSAGGEGWDPFIASKGFTVKPRSQRRRPSRRDSGLVAVTEPGVSR